MIALHQKLFRDLARMWAQAITIALVLACGIASYVSMRGAHASILTQRDSFYSDQRFADVFAHIERAPRDALSARIERMDGVATTHLRIVESVLLPIEGQTSPAVGQIVSLDPRSATTETTSAIAPLNAPRIRQGRSVEPGRADEALLLESFANAHKLHPGDSLEVILNGTARRLRIVGLAMSPEYIFAVGAGGFMNDPARFGVLWMDRDAVAAAFRMESSFNDVVLSLQPGASEVKVIEELREILKPYGVLTAHGRDRQLSHHVLDGELQQLSSYAIVAPAIFLGVAAFLINVVLVRTLSLQRGQIATLKAIGYTNREIAQHYLGLVLLILLGGALLGLGLGELLGRGMISLYQPFFRFPDLTFRLDAGTFVVALLISAGAGLMGAFIAILRAVRIPPAEAMLPEAPVAYRRRWQLRRRPVFGVSGRMVLREIFRRPLRAALSTLAIALATATVVSGRFADDSISMLFELVFERAQHDDIEVAFHRPMPASVTNELAALPGVLRAEGVRQAAVRVHADQRYRDVPLVAHEGATAATSSSSLRGLAQWPMPSRPFEPPEEGVAISRKLAEVLDARLGSTLDVELLEGDRRRFRVPVSVLLDDVFGLAIHMTMPTLRRLLDEEANVTSVLLVVDGAEGHEDRLLARLSKIPRVAYIARKDEVVAKFHEQTQYMWTTMAILTAMGATIAFGVIYNQARIALSTRSRDLASLRVLGLTRHEVSSILLGELAIYTVFGVPLGWVLGHWLVTLITSTVDPESYRMPTVVSASTYAFASVVTLIAALLSALIVRRRVDHLDLVSVLKARD